MFHQAVSVSFLSGGKGGDIQVRPVRFGPPRGQVRCFSDNRRRGIFIVLIPEASEFSGHVSTLVSF